MQHFLKKILFFLIPITLFLLSGLFLPPTPRAAGSFLFSERQKDSLLKYTTEPRMIFVGGSNLSFGLNSAVIKDSLHVNPVNTGVNVAIGLKYMLQNTLQYVKKSDTLIIAPEYEFFYHPYDVAFDELLRTVFDVSHNNIKFLSFKQAINLIGYIPKFSLTKFDPTEYWGFKESDVYSVNSYNAFGDVDAHWNLQPRKFHVTGIEGKFNEEVVKKLKEFEAAVNTKGAVVYVTFPSLDEATYNISKDKVTQVEHVLQQYHFNLLGTARRYIMPSDMMFNSKYHLTKAALDYRTNLFISDFEDMRNSHP